MSALSPLGEIARAARIGDMAAINAALDAHHNREAVLAGRAAADRERRRDPPLPETESLAIGPGQPPLPTIYPGRAVHKTRRRKSI